MPDTGVKYPGAAADAIAGGGGTAWTNPNNALTDDGASATGTTETHFLFLTNFSMGVPAGATIDGVLVEVKPGAGHAAAQNTYRLLKAGAFTGTAKNDFGITPGVYNSQGGAADLWGATLTESDVNNAGFGVSITCGNGGKGSQAAQIDTIRITVYYTGGGGGPAASSAFLAFF